MFLLVYIGVIVVSMIIFSVIHVRYNCEGDMILFYSFYSVFWILTIPCTLIALLVLGIHFSVVFIYNLLKKGIYKRIKERIHGSKIINKEQIFKSIIPTINKEGINLKTFMQNEIIIDKKLKEKDIDLRMSYEKFIKPFDI